MEWMLKSRGYTKFTRGEVLVYPIKKQEEQFTCIRFLGNSCLKITKTEYIIFAIEGTRLYFKEANRREGWKLCGDNSKFFKVYEKWLPLTSIEEGEYILEFDSKLGLFFIDVKNKLKDNSLNFRYKGGK